MIRNVFFIDEKTLHGLGTMVFNYSYSLSIERMLCLHELIKNIQNGKTRT